MKFTYTDRFFTLMCVLFLVGYGLYLMLNEQVHDAIVVYSLAIIIRVTYFNAVKQ